MEIIIKVGFEIMVRVGQFFIRKPDFGAPKKLMIKVLLHYDMLGEMILSKS